MFGKPKLFKQYADVIRQLEHGDRRPAQHVRPRTVRDNGFESFASPSVEAVFDGFEYFGAVLNQQVVEPWTIEETGQTLVNDPDSDSPDLGRTYNVHYNGFRLGRLQVTAGFNLAGGLNESFEWHRQNRAARVLIDLEYLRFIPHHHALSLVSTVELFVGQFADNDSARRLATAKATTALSGYIWEVQRAEDYVPAFDHRTEGPYDLLQLTTERWKESGVDPFERWNGDRLR